MTLIERAERATTREEAVAVFEEAADLLPHALTKLGSDFDWQLEAARTSRSDTRALGYLLLAAMAVVPEGRDWWRAEDGTMYVQEQTWEMIAGGPMVCGGFGRAPALALLAAILRANEASDDR